MQRLMRRLTLRACWWASLVTAGAATLILVRQAFFFTTHKVTIDSIGSCAFCRYQVYPRPAHCVAPGYQTLHDHAETLIALLIPFLLIAALPLHQLWLARLARLASERGRAPRLLWSIRDTPRWANRPRWIMIRWAVACLLLARYVPMSLSRIRAFTEVSDVLAAGISLPFSALNATWSAREGSLSRQHDHPVALETRTPFIQYASLYPYDRLEIPSHMNTTAYYLPHTTLPLLESHFITSAKHHLAGPLGKEISKDDIRLGDAFYTSTETFGAGINLTTYDHWVGDGHAGLPREFTLDYLYGSVYGTVAPAHCYDASQAHSLNPDFLDDDRDLDDLPEYGTIFDEFDSTSYYTLKPDRREHATVQVFSDLGFKNLSNHFNFTGLDDAPTPGVSLVHTIYIITGYPDYYRYFPVGAQPELVALECVYHPTDVALGFLIRGRDAPRVQGDDDDADNNQNNSPVPTARPGLPSRGIELYDEPPEGSPLPKGSADGDPLPRPSPLDPILALPAARAIHELFLMHDLGAKLASVWSGAGYLLPRHQGENGEGDDGDDQPYDGYRLIDEVIAPILSDTAGAYFSLLRQRVEAANAWPTCEQTEHAGALVKVAQIRLLRVAGVGLGSGNSYVVVMGAGWLLAMLCVLARLLVVRFTGMDGWWSTAVGETQEKERKDVEEKGQDLEEKRLKGKKKEEQKGLLEDASEDKDGVVESSHELVGDLKNV